MKQVTTMQGGDQARVKPSHAKTIHDALPLPDGRKVGDVREVTPIFVALGIPGASHENGRLANAEAYAAHLHGIRNQAADTAVAEWLAANWGNMR